MGTFPISHNGQTRRGASAFCGRFRVCIYDHVHFPHLRGVRLGPSGPLTRAMCARVPSSKCLTMSVSVLYSECVLWLSPARPAWFLRLALSRPVRAPPPPPRAVLCADRVPIVRRYPSSQECAPACASSFRAPRRWGAAPPGGGSPGLAGACPVRARRGRGRGPREGGRQYEKAARGPQPQLLGGPHSAACAPVQPWLSLRWTPVPPSSSATRSPVQPPEHPLPRRRSPDRDPGRPEMTATGALLRVLLLLLAFGHRTYGEPPWRLGSRPLWGSLRCPADHPADHPIFPVPCAPSPARPA